MHDVITFPCATCLLVNRRRLSLTASRIQSPRRERANAGIGGATIYLYRGQCRVERMANGAGQGARTGLIWLAILVLDCRMTLRMNNREGGGQGNSLTTNLSYYLAIVLSRLVHFLSPHLVSRRRRRCHPSERRATDAEATHRDDHPRRRCCSSSRVPIRRFPR